jgi:hypothetical protein
MSVTDFLHGKPQPAIGLFDHLVAAFDQIGPVSIHAAKTMIGFAAVKKFAYVIQFGKNFIDLVIPFKQRYDDNLCFHKIKPVPGSDDFNHHIRIYSKDDINEEVIGFLKIAYTNNA